MTSCTRTVTRRDGAQLLTALNTASQSTTLPQSDRRVEGILKQLNAGRFMACEHLVEVGYNLIDRGAALEPVEEPGHRYVALMRVRYRERYGAVDIVGHTLGSLMLEERLAHAEREKMLALFLNEKSVFRAHQLLQVAASYERANRQFSDGLRECAVAANGARMAVMRSR